MSDYEDLMIKDEGTISESLHEKEMTRMETANKRWFISFLVLLFLFVATNAGWIIYESQFQDVSIQSEVDTGEGDATIVGVGVLGDVSYGEGEADDQDPR